jgi:hypothetical protein
VAELDGCGGIGTRSALPRTSTRAAVVRVAVRRFALVGLGIAALALPAAARADIGLRVTTKVVHADGNLRGWSNGAGFPVYIVASSRAPKRYSCHGGSGICEPTSRRPPGRPFVLLGRVPGRFGAYGRHRFAFTLPRVRPGLYRVFVYCRPCGGSLIQSGDRVAGETISVRR